MSQHVKTGYTFDNFIVPQGEWGELLTADDMRYTWLFGVDLTATNGQEASDEQLKTTVDFALAEFEAYLGIDIRTFHNRSQISFHGLQLLNFLLVWRGVLIRCALIADFVFGNNRCVNPLEEMPGGF